MDPEVAEFFRDEIWQRVKGRKSDQIVGALGSEWSQITKDPISYQGGRLFLHSYRKDDTEFAIAFKQDGLPAFVVFDDTAIGHMPESTSRTTKVFPAPSARAGNAPSNRQAAL